MKLLLGTILLIGLLPLLAAAQDSKYSRGHGYFYVAPGVRTAPYAKPRSTIQVGGGGEAFFTRHLGLGADLGGLKVSGADWLGTLSPNFVARFRAKDDENKVEPFVTGGYTLFFRSGTVSGYNFGGGINYWFRDRVGVRFEARDSVWVASDAPDLHLVGFRIGVTFR